LPFDCVITHAADGFDTSGKRYAIELADRQTDKDFEPSFVRAKSIAEGKHAFGVGTIDRPRNQECPNAPSPADQATPDRLHWQTVNAKSSTDDAANSFHASSAALAWASLAPSAAAARANGHGRLGKLPH